MNEQELHALEVELDEYGSISKADALRLIAVYRQLRAMVHIEVGAIHVVADAIGDVSNRTVAEMDRDE